jgi:hypothetical protein
VPLLLPSWERKSAAWILLLVGLVFGLDLLWAALVGGTGSVLYGFLDEPAHLLTCLVALIALAVARGGRLPAAFAAAALLGSIAIDLDHLPGILGWSVLTGAGPRPCTHSLLVVAALLGLGLAAAGRYRLVMLGLAFGVSAHLFRDLATGPGIPLFWPLGDGGVRVDYALYAVLLAALGMGAGLGRRRAPIPARAAATAAVAAVALLGVLSLGGSEAQARTVSIGAYVPGADNNKGLIENLHVEIGRQPAILLSYKDFSQAPFVYDQLDEISATGAVPLITWEPWTDSGGVSLEAIANGSYDGYLDDAAKAAAGWEQPLMVRFAQEPNGPWFPWGKQPRAYRAAWHHIVGVFRAAGAYNVRWVWTPYVDSGGQLAFRKYYPGDRFVDWAGLDGINWGGNFAWRTPKEVFGASYHELISFTSKPLILAETGSGESGGSKAHWISAMLNRLVPRLRHVFAVAFWSVDDYRGDIRVDSSGEALGALQRSLRRPLYESSRRRVERTPARVGRHRRHG